MPPKSTPPEPLRCDFCDKTTRAVRRIALDEGYDRLQRPHQEQYACADCSAKKEGERRARTASTAGEAAEPNEPGKEAESPPEG